MRAYRVAFERLDLDLIASGLGFLTVPLCLNFSQTRFHENSTS
jgi:hypothetical protein